MSLLHHDAKIDRLAEIPLFADADKTALKHLAQAADEVSLTAGATIITEGHRHNEGYVVIAGTFDVEVGGEKVAEIGEGEMIGELGFFGHGAASATVRAKTDVTVLVLPYNRFDQILDDNPPLAKALAMGLAARLAAMDARHGDG